MLKTMQVSLQLVFAQPQNCRDLLPHPILRQAKNKQTNKQEKKKNKTDLFSLSLSLSLLLSLKFREKKEIPHPPKFSTKQYTHKNISNLEKLSQKEDH
jgi:hypothetical protein